MRVTLVHNPGAGAGMDRDDADLPGLIRAEGHELRLVSAADEDWKAALEASTDVVAVAGGDGTVARVAKAMAGRGIPVAPLPAGTANNLSRTLGLVGRHWEELVRGWPQARRVKLDLGIARGPWGERAFIEGVGAGLFACLLSDDDPDRQLAQHKEPEARVAHALDMLKRRAIDCAPIEMRGTLDGEPVSGRFLLAELLNTPYVGPNLYLAPDSEPGDGTFDIVIVGEAERDRLVNYLQSWQDNRDRLAVLPTRRGKHLRLEWTGFELHIDDELWPAGGGIPGGAGAIDLRMQGAVEFLAPDAKRK
ncbi:MAG TPA: diacylglycerol kinase family protein [Burkholderiales bacterium]|nr:diacylglycerol kinase family protein [Burkholderiales bacterium]